MTALRESETLSKSSAGTVPIGRLIGREKIVDALFTHIAAGQSVLLIGAAGMGKTAVFRAARDRQTCHTRRLLYCAHASTVKAVLKSLAGELCDRETGIPLSRRQGEAWTSGLEETTSSSVNTLSIRKLRRLVMPCLRSGQYAVLLDHVGPVRGAYATFLDELVECLHVPIVVAARSLHPDENGRLWWVGCRFVKVEMPALTSSEARQLAEETLERNAICLPDRHDFVRELAMLARGNPSIITRICDMARASRYQINGRTDLRLLHLDLQVRDLQDRIDAESRIPIRGPIATDSAPQGMCDPVQSSPGQSVPSITHARPAELVVTQSKRGRG
jgi:hypothetical protein